MSPDQAQRQEAATNQVGAPPPGKSTPAHSVGAMVAGKYRLERLIGEGGMGSVWRAMNVHLEVPVAIKLLRAGLASSELSERLRIEARAAARLVHPSIVRVFDIGEASTGEPFIVMELLTGEGFSDRVHRERPTPQDAVRMLLPMAEALSLAHSLGIVHRDLKPDNIFMCPDGDYTRPKLLDFGIAKVIDGSPLVNLTQRGTLVGSPAYMSPEQAKGSDAVDYRTDIWSFCVVLYEAISGKLPFGAADGVALLRAIVQDPPESITHVPGVDDSLWSLLTRGMSKDPAQRPSSMTELGHELALWLKQHHVEQDITGTPLESKWLPRSLRPEGSTPEVVFALSHARTEAQHSTLQSVTKSERGDPDSAPFRQRRSRWPLIFLAAASVLALAGGAAWSKGVFESTPETTAPAQGAATAAVQTAVPELPKSLEAPLQPSAPPVQQMPEPTPAAVPPAPEQTVEKATETPSRAAPPSYRRPARPAARATPSPAPEHTPYPLPVPPVISLPPAAARVEPRPVKPVPSTPSDLMDPY